jgi:GntR family transcriptional regulator, arabinose operon transcriptional repressor
MTTIKTASANTSSTSTHQIADLLRSRIQAGEYHPGERLPSLRELSSEFQLDKAIIRMAIQGLEQEGLVVRPPNCRATVRDLNSDVIDIPAKPAPRKLSQFVALIMRRGKPIDDGRSGQERIFLGINQVLLKTGRHTIFMDMEDSRPLPGEPTDVIAAYLEYADDQEFGGIVCYGDYGMDRSVLRRVAKSIPVVLIDRSLPGIDVDFVGVTNFKGTYGVVKYLIDLGHKRIAFVSRMEPITTVGDRMMGYKHALTDSFGSDYFEMVITEPSEGPDPWLSLDQVFAMPAGNRPTALVCVNDNQAVIVAERAIAAGMRIPEDLSIVGFDNAVTTLPGGVGLTTVEQPHEQIGIEAGKLILRRFDEPDADTQEVECPTRLVIRDSCASPR